MNIYLAEGLRGILCGIIALGLTNIIMFIAGTNNHFLLYIIGFPLAMVLLWKSYQIVPQQTNRKPKKMKKIKVEMIGSRVA